MAEVKIIGQMDNTLDHTFESANRVYDKNNLCPTLNTCGGGQLQPKVIEETRCVGGLSMSKWGTQYHQQDRVYKGDIALAQPANLPEGSYKYIVASRGRNPENTSDRKKGSQMEQRLELKKDGCTNTITTVQKDNMVLETKIEKIGQISNEGSQCGTVVSDEGLAPTLSAGTHGYANAHICTEVKIKQATKEGSIKCKVGGCYDASYPDSKTRRGRVQEGGDVTPTITAQGGENINYVETVYRIRKLTPKECWRLMGYTDEDYEKASKVNSNTQLYKQAGNAIVKQVLMAIFSQLNIKGVKAWNDMTETEKRAIIKKTTMAGE
jgi:DNA (cytosine-5)-methyltransferase 1